MRVYKAQCSKVGVEQKEKLVEIIVTLKQVPDPEAPKESFRIDEAEMKILNPANIDPVINGYDENAVEAALMIAWTSHVVKAAG